MNRKITIASAFLAASAAFAGPFQTWIGTDGFPQVSTGLGNDTETYGYWFGYDDNGDGGKSEIVWGGPLGNDDDSRALDRVILACNGICGDAALDKGTLTYEPFIGVGFNIVGETSANDNTPLAADASALGGICITYTAETAAHLELGLGDEVDQTIKFANPAATLPKSSAGTKKVILWEDFKQPSWYTGDVKIDGPTAAKQLVALKIKIQAPTGKYKFNIAAIGPSDGSCPETVALKPVRGSSAVNAVLSGRTLGFSGVTAATAEILNLQGQVVLKGAVNKSSSTLDLSSLDAGVYMVRVVGKSVNFVKKIELK